MIVVLKMSDRIAHTDHPLSAIGSIRQPAKTLGLSLAEFCEGNFPNRKSASVYGLLSPTITSSALTLEAPISLTGRMFCLLFQQSAIDVAAYDPAFGRTDKTKSDHRLLLAQT